MSETLSASILISAVVALASFIAFLIHWILNRVDKQTKINAGILTSLEKLSSGLDTQIKESANAHKQSADILKQLAESSRITCSILLENFNKNGGSEKC